MAGETAEGDFFRKSSPKLFNFGLLAPLREWIRDAEEVRTTGVEEEGLDVAPAGEEKVARAE